MIKLSDYIKKLFCVAIAALLVLNTAGCAVKDMGADSGSLAKTQYDGDRYQLTAGVMYGGDSEDWKYLDEFLRQSTLLNVNVEDYQVSDTLREPECDVLYLHDSVACRPDDGIAAVLKNYVADGGILVVPNSLYASLPDDLLGAKNFTRIDGCPVNMSFPKNKIKNLEKMQMVLSDFSDLYPSFHDYETLSQQDYGYAMAPNTAEVIASSDDGALYTVNLYGNGACFFINPLLPNGYCQTNMAMEQEKQQVSAFSSTAQSAGRLFLDSVLEYAAKQKYGYCLSRVYGYFGSSAMSWELHFEEITGMANEAMKSMYEMCREYQQIPSFTLVRNTYTWFLKSESVTYLLNSDDGYQMDMYENAYSSGTHIDADGQWLSQQSIENTGSYFDDQPEENYRAYPVVLDYDGNGTADIFSGSEDGYIRYYSGIGYEDKLKVSGAVLVTADGAPLQVGSFSAPALLDIDGDGYPDLICGGMGGVLNWYRGNGSLDFSSQGQLLDPDLPGQVLPAAGDLDGDGIADLVVGSDKGTLMIYYGQKDGDRTVFSYDRMQSLSGVCAENNLGNWIAPTVSGRKIYVGTFDGYVAEVDDKNKTAVYLTEKELNYKGNANIKFGNYAVPAFYDLNGDGKKDLICGDLEYGLAYPVDSSYFPYQEQLRSQIQYVKDHDLYVGLHFMTNTYESPEREAYELEAQKKALAFYGLDVNGNIGANQHTWFTSPTTMENCRKAGLKWNSGFGSYHSSWRSPHNVAETVIALPFFYTGGSEDEEEFLVQNVSVMRYGSDEWYNIATRYGMPMNIYYHCDFIYKEPDSVRKEIEKVSDFEWKYHYAFCREDQEMEAVAAASHLQVEASGSLQTGLTVEACPEDDFPLYRENVAGSLGVRLSPADGISADDIVTDADVWHKDGTDLYLALNRPVMAVISAKQTDRPHLAEINTAAEVKATDEGYTVTFTDSGMLQAVVDGSAGTSGEGWETQRRDGMTVFTKYGNGGTLNINVQGG